MCRLILWKGCTAKSFHIDRLNLYSHAATVITENDNTISLSKTDKQRKYTSKRWFIKIYLLQSKFLPSFLPTVCTVIPCKMQILKGSLMLYCDSEKVWWKMRICEYADMRVCGYAGMRICGYAYCN